MNLRNGFLAIALSVLSIHSSTQQGPTAAQNKSVAELLALHQDDRRAHFARDTETLVGGVAKELLDVRDGQINHLSPEDVRRRFTEYFRNVTFTAWDDIEPPIVRVSSDGLMAWMIVRVRIKYDHTDAQGKTSSQSSVMAWMSAYEKHDGKWVLVAVTSTTAS